MSKCLVVHTDPIICPVDAQGRRALEEVGAALELIELRSVEVFRRLAPKADAILNAEAQLTAPLIESPQRCRVISRYGTGVDNIDVAAATARGIMVANVVIFCNDEVADRAMALLLACSCRLLISDQNVRQGRWRESLPFSAKIKGATLGLVGFGRIAQAVASRAQAFGLQVLAHDPYVEVDVFQAKGVTSSPLDTLLSESDFVSLHVPLTEETYHLLNAERLSLMKPSAILVNCARGAVVDEAALVSALSEGRISGAGLDVLEREPPSTENSLFALKGSNVILTPHSASYSQEAIRKVRYKAVDNVVRALRGELPEHLVNPGVMRGQPKAV